MIKENLSELALFGGPQAFNEPVHVGRPNIGDLAHFYSLIEGMFDRRWFSNNGPIVQEFEKSLAEYIGVKNVVCVCNATVGLEIAVRALGLRGNVVVPSFTFIATAHALEWQKISPKFADIDKNTHNIDLASLESAIDKNTSGIIATNLWGRACDVNGLEEIARRHEIPLIFDSAHAFANTYKGKNIGQFGDIEVFSFHATKFFSTFEGGAICTNNDELAKKLRLMTNFGFAGLDTVIDVGTNGKMTEVCAAMGLGNLKQINEIIDLNQNNYNEYKSRLKHLECVKMVEYDAGEKNNFHYIVLEVLQNEYGICRDQILRALTAEKILARKYFWPCCHRMEPYKSRGDDLTRVLRNTNEVASRVLVLPNGQGALGKIEVITSVIDTILRNGGDFRHRLEHLT